MQTNPTAGPESGDTGEVKEPDFRKNKSTERRTQKDVTKAQLHPQAPLAQPFQQAVCDLMLRGGKPMHLKKLPPDTAVPGRGGRGEKCVDKTGH